MSDLLTPTRNPRRHWFQTYTGTKFFAMDPHTSEVNMTDIAHSLSNVCRYGGHCITFYSVGQHSIYTADCIAEEHFGDHLLILQCFLHDAAEAYSGDMKRPIKIELPEFVAIEDRISTVVYDALGVPFPDEAAWSKIKWADNTVLMAERRDIVNHLDEPWNIKEEPWHATIDPWPSGVAKRPFLDTWNELYGNWMVIHKLESFESCQQE